MKMVERWHYQAIPHRLRVRVRDMVRVVLSSETGLGLILLLGDPLGPVSLLLFLL